MLHFFFHLQSRPRFSSHSPILQHLLHFHHLSPNSPNPSNLTTTTTNLSNLLQGQIPHSHILQTHARIFRICQHQDNLTATRLIGHYSPPLALRVFHQLQKPNIFPYNAIIRVLAEHDLCSQSFIIFKILKIQSFSPNDLTLCFLLKGCIRANDGNYVKQIHTHVVKSGYVDNPFVCNGLLAAYSKGLRDLVSARKVFDDLPERSGVSCWTSLIDGFARSGKSEDALALFLLMVKENRRPDDDTMVSVLSACSNMKIVSIEKWVRVLSKFVVNSELKGLLGHDSVNTVLVYFFGKYGVVDKSRERFDEVSDQGKRSVLPWNAMIGAYVQNGCAVEGLNLFQQMMGDRNCTPNHVTLVSVLSGCAQIGDLDRGIWVHKYIKLKVRRDIFASNRNLATALIDMYSKSGSLERAREVFYRMANKDVVSCNAMIMGLAVNGEGEEALSLFATMQEYGLQPNAGTFISVLSACSHSGLLEKGRQIFVAMTQNFFVPPKLEHYGCYIDLLARVGSLEEALEVVTSMPFEPNSFVWGSLLSGCLLHNRVELARHISNILVEVDPANSAGYVLLSNAFAGDSRWMDVSGLRWFMREKGVKKQPAHSWITIEGVVHEFLVGSPSHPQIVSIYSILDMLLKEMKLTCLLGKSWSLSADAYSWHSGSTIECCDSH